MKDAVASAIDVEVARVQVGFPCEFPSVVAGIATEENDAIADLNVQFFAGHTSGTLSGFTNQGGVDWPGTELCM